MRLFNWLLISFLFLISCKNKNSSIANENDILSREKITEILEDMILLEAYNNKIVFKTLNMDLTNKDSLYRIQFNTILKKHKTSNDIFEKSYKYYFSSPEKMQEIISLLKEKIDNVLNLIPFNIQNR